MKKIAAGALFSFCMCSVAAQDLPVNPVLLHGSWPAHWISCPSIVRRGYSVCHFRKKFFLENVPSRCIVHLSADNRYRLWINGYAAGSGPARGDLAHWFFETIDIGPYLKKGENLIAALVWNMGEYAAVGQISNQTAFLVQADDTSQSFLNTGTDWKTMNDPAYHPCSLDAGSRMHTYVVVGPGDEVNGDAYPWEWEQPAFKDDSWQGAVSIADAVTTGYGTDNLWTLVPATIPAMDETLQRIPVTRRMEGLKTGLDFTDGAHPLTIPAHDTVSILLDQTFNTVAFPELISSGGAGASVRLTYAEALIDSLSRKGNRNEIEGKKIVGLFDIFKPDGGSKRLFRPLWFRTFRYLQLDIVTHDQPLVIEDLYGKRTGYPFTENASFASSDSSLKEIWRVGWRTARLCAGENYFDCPYYEQLQYEADTRIQCLISLYVSGDDRLMRKALTDFFNSRVSEGLTQGRYPSNRLQVIPTFSLFYISMLHDYWMHRKDDSFLLPHLNALRGILDWYEKRIDPVKKMLGPMPWWNFADWNPKFRDGVPDGATDGNSAVISLQLAYTLEQASELMRYFKFPKESEHYERLSWSLAENTYRLCFDTAKGVMANSPEKKTFSQHASIMGVLSGSIPPALQQPVMNRVLEDHSLSQATFYYRFYLNQAMKKAGMANRYYSQLKPWRDMLAEGLTTFAENPDPTRSDCHAWSASPVYDFLSTICGIVPDAPGFGAVRIAPAPGELTWVQCSMPHPRGWIRLFLKRTGAQGISGEVSLPPNTAGKFVWNNQEILLHAGTQKISL
jgi:alpha-L-rhamnosidase